jgi:protein ImuB
MAAVRPALLWLAVRFCELPRAALADTGGLAAVIEGLPGRQRVVAVSPAAQAQGLMPGLSRSAAEVRLPAVMLVPRAPVLEARALQERARRAFALTPFVSLEAPDTLLLEIAGSVRLFGGLEALLQQADALLGTQQLPVTCAVAPTVQAALWLVRGRPGTCVRTAAELPGALAAVPLAVTGWDDAVLSTCERLGVTTVGELARLPRDGIARRLAPQVPRCLDRAFGREPEPRRRHVVPERFTETVEPPAEIIGTDALQPWCERLFAAQERYLVQRDAAVSQCRLRLRHRGDQAPTVVVLERALSSARAAEWLLLLGERLGRLTLQAPVIAVSLRSGPVLPAVPLGGGLVEDAQVRQAAAARLLDRLRARLGEAAVHALSLVPEHRPESAYRRVGPVWPVVAEPLDDVPTTPRPCWLLTAAERLMLRGGRPWYDGALTLQSGPERIESGWWSGAGIARDYYVARTAGGVRLWIYRQRDADGAGEWYLHGVFA